MKEIGALIGTGDRVLHWHTPPDRSESNLPDSAELWNLLWEAHCNGILVGFAHSHPGSNTPQPSYEDISTFAAIEAGLGRTLTWWIASASLQSIRIERHQPEPGRLHRATVYQIRSLESVNEPWWMMELRRRSEMQI